MLSGRIVACKWVRLACERHRRDLANGANRGLYFDENAASHAIEFFKFLRHSKGEWGGSVFELLPWQQFILWCVFGWMKSNGLRRFSTAYIEVARKNGKTTKSAGVGLYLFDADEEPGAEIYSVATKLDQARISHRDAIAMVRKSPELSSRITIYKDSLSVTETGSRFVPLGKDSTTLDGLNVHGAIVDELHAHPDGSLLQVLDTATGARRQPLIFIITTAGNDETSYCYAKRTYVTQVLDGLIEDDSTFGIIYTLDDGDDWQDETKWIKSNPSLGETIKLDYLRTQATKAKQSLLDRNEILQKNFNLWVKQSICWLPVEKWDACGQSMRDEELAGFDAIGGLDLANTLDIAAFVLTFRVSFDPELYYVRPVFWIPNDRLQERQRRNLFRLDAWVEEGLIIRTDGDVIDHDRIRHDIDELARRFRIRSILYDPYNATQLAVNMMADGLDMVEFRQSMPNYTEPTKKLEQLVLNRQIQHGGQKVLRWMAGNCSVKSNAVGYLMPARKESRDKIDGICALIMSLAGWLEIPDEGGKQCEVW